MPGQAEIAEDDVPRPDAARLQRGAPDTLGGDGGPGRTPSEVQDDRVPRQSVQREIGEARLIFQDAVGGLDVRPEVAHHGDVVHDAPLVCQPDDMRIHRLGADHLQGKFSPRLAGDNDVRQVHQSGHGPFLLDERHSGRHDTPRGQPQLAQKP